MTPQAEWKRVRPAASLAPYVDFYIGYRMTGFPPGLHRGLPSRNLTFIVSIGPTIDLVQQADPKQSNASYRAIVAGLHTSPASISHGGYQEGVSVALSPLGARTLLGMPAREIWSTSVELSEIFGSDGDNLWEKLQGESDWDGRMMAMNQVLRSRLQTSVEVGSELAHAWRCLVQSSGLRSVSSVAAEVGWSRQHLTRRFTDEFGLSPKRAARVFRFNKAAKILEAAPAPIQLAEIALACGYYDQAHMTNEFVALGGAPPGRIFEGEVTNLQDESALVVAQ